MLVFTGQGNVYLVRERKRLWNSWPSRWLIFSSVADVLIVSALAIEGVLMAPIQSYLVASLLGVALVFLLLIDGLKVRIFHRFAVR